ncbi:hypothetical protein G7054_g3496 [Neopestalotiopsis clavispora]|nr:hypothetical protein G7054_g3496 [Neopestalotiopsis clavispora]
MSMTLAIPNVQSEIAVGSEENLRSGVPSITSLRSSHGGTSNVANIGNPRLLAVTEESLESQRGRSPRLALSQLSHDETSRQDQNEQSNSVSALSLTPDEADRNEDSNSVPSALLTQQSDECTVSVASDNQGTEATAIVQNEIPVASEEPRSEAEDETPKAEQAPGAQGRSAPPIITIDTAGRSDGGTDADVGGNPQSDTSDATLPSSSTSQTASTTASTPSASTPSAAAKGKEPVRWNRLKNVNVHVPRGRLATLLPVRIATPDIVKAELLTKVGFSEPFVSEPPKKGFPAAPRPMIEPMEIESSKKRFSAVLSPIMEPLESDFGGALQSFHLYHPISNDETYCGALFQTLVDGKPWVSTLGGVVEVGDSMYIMTCQHAPSRLSGSTTNVPSFVDTLLDEENKKSSSLQSAFQKDTGKPLVFLTDDFSEGMDLPQIPEEEDVTDRITEEWKQLSLDGVITVGSEWSLLPVQSHSLLPNFIEESIEDSRNLNKRERHYLDQISEPRGGHPALIATNSDSHPTGIVLANSSFIVAGGTDGLIEVWTVMLDNGQNIQKGDSGSWVVDTSDPVHYKVIGTAIATSDGAAHFVRLVDQFYEIGKSLGGRENVDLVPAFRALVSHANLAFLEQFHSGWFMTGLKSFLGDYGDDGQSGVANEERSGPARRSTLKSLLLRYGCELLDSLLDSTDFKKRHARELFTSHWQTFEALEKVLQQARSDELKRLEEIAAIKEQSRKDAARQASPQMREMRQITFAVPDHNEPARQGKEHLFGLEIYPKPGSLHGIALLGILWLLVLAEGLSSLFGVAAAAVAHLVQLKTGQQSTDISNSEYEALGAVIGPISVTVTILQILLIFFSQTYHWSLLCGSRSADISSTGWTGWTRLLFFVALSAASAIARTILPTLYVARQRSLENDGNTFAAAAVAAVPSLLSSASPSIFWNLAAFYSRFRETNGVARARRLRKALLSTAVFIFWISMIGFDSLAGYTFGRIIQSSGRYIPSPSSAAAGGALLSTLTTILVSLPLTHFCWHLCRNTIKAQRLSNAATLELGPLRDYEDERAMARPARPPSIQIHQATPPTTSPATSSAIPEATHVQKPDSTLDKNFQNSKDDDKNRGIRPPSFEFRRVDAWKPRRYNPPSSAISYMMTPLTGTTMQDTPVPYSSGWGGSTMQNTPAGWEEDSEGNMFRAAHPPGEREREGSDAGSMVFPSTFPTDPSELQRSSGSSHSRPSSF